MGATLAEVLRTFGPAYLRDHSLSTPQARAWRAIVACRTPALGGQLQRCDRCGREQRLFRSCRNRHCPQCQNHARDAWRQARLAELLPVPYCHLVFTLPHALNDLAHFHERWVYRTLMHCVASTLTEFAANPRWLGGIGAFTLVLHTWTQDLRRHLHVHALMACGALDADGHWCVPTRSPTFLFPVHALSRVFRAQVHRRAAPRAPGRRACRAIRPAHDGGAPIAAGELRATSGWSMPRRRWPAPRWCWTTCLATRTAWPSPTSASSASMPRACACACAPTITAASERSSSTGPRSSQRFLQHVLPPGFKRIRHYGLLSAAAKSERLAQARLALAMPTPDARACEDAAAFLKRVTGIELSCCPHCRLGHWQTVQVLPPERASRAPSSTHAGDHRESQPVPHPPWAGPSPKPRRWCRLWPRPRSQGPGTLQRACPVLEPRIDHHRSQLAHPHRRIDALYAPQRRRLNLTLPNSPARQHRVAVQSIDVYLTPSASARPANAGSASDKCSPTG